MRTAKMARLEAEIKDKEQHNSEIEVVSRETVQQPWVWG